MNRRPQLATVFAFIGLLLPPYVSAYQWQDADDAMQIVESLFKAINSKLPDCKGDYINDAVYVDMNNTKDSIYNWRNCIGLNIFSKNSGALGGEFGSEGVPNGQVIEFRADVIFRGTLRIKRNADEVERHFYMGQGAIYFPDGRAFLGELSGEHNEMICQQSDTERRQECDAEQETVLFWSGVGTYTWPDGSKHEGRFVDTLADGPGVRYSPDGRVVSRGIFKRGTLIRDSGPSPSPSPDFR